MWNQHIYNTFLEVEKQVYNLLWALNFLQLLLLIEHQVQQDEQEVVDQSHAEHCLRHEDPFLLLQPHRQHDDQLLQQAQQDDLGPVVVVQAAVDCAPQQSSAEVPDRQEHEGREYAVEAVDEVAEALAIEVVAQEVEATGARHHEKEDHDRRRDQN